MNYIICHNRSCVFWSGFDCMLTDMEIDKNGCCTMLEHIPASEVSKETGVFGAKNEKR